ncbi:MAG: thiamine phosphate synthase, partial [Gammaproteobacteria bacterium]
MSSHSQSLRGLYAVTDGRLTPDKKLLPAVEAAIRGGARLVQYRDKTNEKTRRESEARALLQLCHDHDVQMIINDDVN